MTEYTRVLTKKAAAEQRKKEQEQSLRSLIVAKCNQYGFKCRFLYQSVIITTPISDWSFDYHTPRITLYHESTVKTKFMYVDDLVELEYIFYQLLEIYTKNIYFSLL